MLRKETYNSLQAEVKRIDRAYKSEVDRCNRVVNKAEKWKQEVARYVDLLKESEAEIKRLREPFIDGIMIKKSMLATWEKVDEELEASKAEIKRLKEELAAADTEGKE